MKKNAIKYINKYSYAEGAGDRACKKMKKSEDGGGRVPWRERHSFNIFINLVYIFIHLQERVYTTSFACFCPRLFHAMLC